MGINKSSVTHEITTVIYIQSAINSPQLFHHSRAIETKLAAHYDNYFDV